MQSGDVGDSCSSTLVAEVRGPGMFSFDWKVSSEPDRDLLAFYLDGSLVGSISDQTPWATVPTEITTGVHHLEWTYTKDGQTSAGNDCGWIDNFTWDGSYVILYEDFEPFGTGSWYCGDTNALSGIDTWSMSVLQAGTGSHSLWCSGSGSGWNGMPDLINGYYDRNMNASVSMTLPDLSGTDARLSFQYWAMTNGTDHAYLRSYDGHAWSTLWVQPTDYTDGWAEADLVLPDGARSLEFHFLSDGTLDIGYPGVFIDDLMVTASDSSTPTSWLSPLPAYITGPGTNVTCTANDIGSGVAYVELYYRKGTESYSMYVTGAVPSGQFAPGRIYLDFTALGLTDGPYQFYTVATDRVGNREAAPATADTSTTLDRTAPTTAATTDGNGAPGWNIGQVTVTLTASDQTSGVSSIKYYIDSGALTVYSGPFQFSTPGIHTVHYYSSDNAGNVGITKNITVQMDFQGPASSANVSGVLGHGTWYLTNATVIINASDQLSGVQRIDYRLDDGDWVTYAGSVLVTGPGDHVLRYMATDVAGNPGETGTLTFGVDREAPETIRTMTGPGDPDRMMFNGPVSIALSAQDQASGVALLQYSIDGGSWVDYLNPVTVQSAGPHVLTYRSQDLAGNAEVQRWANFTLDATPPTSNAALTGDRGNQGWYVGNVTVALSASDPGSGVGSISYWLKQAGDDGAWVKYSGPVLVTSEGTHELRYRVIDQANNSEAVRYLNFSIDRTAPRSIVALNGEHGTFGWFNGTVTASITGTDGLSGVVTTLFRVDGAGWVDSGLPFQISGEGNHTLDYLSIDGAGNEERSGMVMVRIDSTPPTVSLSLEDGTVVKQTAITLKVTAGDGGSGIQTVAYRMDDLSYAPCSGGSIDLKGLKNGEHVLTLEVTDAAGNKLVQGLAFQVDAPAQGNGSFELVVIAAIIGLIVVAEVALYARRRKK
jgi:hypothetical protein